MKTETISLNAMMIADQEYPLRHRFSSATRTGFALRSFSRATIRIEAHVVNVVDVSPFAAPAPTSAMRAVEAQAIREAKETAWSSSPRLQRSPRNDHSQGRRFERNSQRRRMRRST